MNQPFQAFLYDFYLTPRGQSLLVSEQKLINDALQNVFGYHLLQIGQPCRDDLLAASRARYHWRVDANLKQSNVPTGQILAELDYLPFKTDSLDAILLPHTLESVADPYHLLREVDRLIVPEGHLILTGFNPYSCSVLRQRLGRYRLHFQSANLMRLSRLIDWLNLLGYDLEWFGFTPVNCFGTNKFNPFAWRTINYLEKGFSHLGIELGSTYCLLAKKRVESVTPIGLNWKLSNWLPKRKTLTVANRHTHRHVK